MRSASIAILLAGVCACARPSGAPSPAGERAPGADPPRRTSITIVLPAEVGAFSTRLQAVGGNSISSRYFHEFVSAYLTTRDLANELVPWLAEDLPSLDKGTLKVLDDGGMEVTWKLRGGVLWHDGTEVTSSDVQFGWDAARDPITQISMRGISRLVESVDTLDRYTSVFRWKQTNQLGNEAGEDQFAEATVPGSAQVADSLTYQDAIGRAVSQTVVRYPYDPRRALALLEELGWRRGSEGALTRAGERFALEYRYNVQGDAEALYPVLQHSYRQVGIDTTVSRLVGPQNLQEHALYPGLLFSGISATIPAVMSRFMGSQVANAQNRYAGQNSHGYQTTEVDRLLASIDASVRAEDRVRAWAQVWRILSDEVAVIPMYYFPSAYVVRRGISGVLPTNPVDTPTYFVHRWEVH